MLPWNYKFSARVLLSFAGGVEMPENTPQRIGDYEIIRELGHGGMGRVYLARNVISDRIEAMKVLLPDLAGRGDFVARFMREIKTLASLDHPNIAALRTAFTSGDQFIMIMEYVEGVTLAQRLDQGAFSTPDALNYTGQVLSALSYAHGKHVIHRDIKPGNMMLTPQGVVKLMDFGLARSADDIGLTATGSTLGSLDYASPEQVQSQPTDERSDLYSLGVSLYQMVTGKRMFSATSSFSIMRAQVMETPPPPIEVVPTLSKGLNDVIMKAVAKDPAQRFQSADAFSNALSQLASATPLTSGTENLDTAITSGVPVMADLKPKMDPGFRVVDPIEPRAKGSRDVWLLAGVIVVAALIIGGAVYRSRQHREESVSAAQPATVPPSTAQEQPAPPPETQTPVTTDEAKPEAQPPAVAARKAKAAGDNAGAPSGPSAAEIQAQQQAALEQKRLLDAMETETDHLDGRAASVESSLDALEQQMHQSGLGLRGDMVAARSNMRNDIAKAKQAMDAGDTERARHFLDLATHEVEKLEAFLGHR
jgi:eukaryotic-like serine/threonine-protein kinase